MSTKILVALFIMVLIYACGKETITSKPSLQFRTVNTTVVPINGILIFEFDFSDQEGDVSDTLYVKKIRTNRRVTQTIRDSFALKVPDAPNKQKGILRVEMGYQNFLISGTSPGTPENDSLLFKFVLKDQANNTSDTLTSEPIVIIRQ